MSKIIDAEDALGVARGAIECIFTAAGKLPKESCDAIQIVADLADTKIKEAIGLQEEYRGASDEENVEQIDDGDALTAAKAGNDRLADLQHCDELNRMKARLYGLEAAVAGAETLEDGVMRDGVLQLFSDVTQQMKRCATMFEAMRQVRENRDAKRPRESA